MTKGYWALGPLAETSYRTALQEYLLDFLPEMGTDAHQALAVFKLIG